MTERHGSSHPPSPITEAAQAIVTERRPAAALLGLRLAGLADEPDAAAVALRDGFAALADPAYRDGVTAIAPGIVGVLGVRTPLRDETARRFNRATHGIAPGVLLRLADRLARAPEPELRWFAIGLLRRVLSEDPERAWQVLRRIARDAGEWVTVDTLAGAFARGILAEPFRWAELEQLVFSPSRWERRLVGSTIATMPFEDRVAGRTAGVAARALDLIGSLIGDAEPDVAKALAWALRSLVLADERAVVAFCRAEADLARATADGHRAWVVRDALPKLPAADAGPIRERLAGIRRVTGAPSTARASDIARDFAAAGALPAADASGPRPATPSPQNGASIPPPPVT